MYNRYIPQADGSYRRSRIPEQNREPKPSPPPQEPPRAPQSSGSSLCPPVRHNHQEQPAPSVGSFLRGLLPQNFDTEDLMVVLLLLLMCGNSGSDQNAALLTLVIYLFL